MGPHVDCSHAGRRPALRKLMTKYASVPMSLADACLVRMTELHTRSAVLTLDNDFGVYRRNGRYRCSPPRPAESDAATALGGSFCASTDTERPCPRAACTSSLPSPVDARRSRRRHSENGTAARGVPLVIPLAIRPDFGVTSSR
jgi:hypothetical protein